MSSIQTLNAQKPTLPVLIKEVKPTKKGINIPFKQYKFPNGLTLVVHEDHSDPIVYVDVTYHVGSAREQVGRSGFAHFFEHMMFQGSDNVGDEEHFKIVTEAGGTLNGTTNMDRTNYFETLPSNQLETALWLESDRMGFFLDAVTEHKFEIQRATVKNERGQNYDNRPYGLANEKTGEALYPFGHPYSWSTIGYIEDLDAATLDDLKDFFLRWYGPNNATLTVAGDVNTEEVIQLVIKYFGNIHPCPEVKNMPKMPVTLPSDRYISYEDNIRFPLLKVTYPSTEALSKEEAALDVLSYVLGDGNNKNALMYERFTKTQKAIQAGASNPAGELTGNFTFSVYAMPNTPLADMKKELDAMLDDFATKGISEDALQEYKATHEADVISRLQSVQGKGSLMASYQTFIGNPDYIQADLDRYLSITKEDVMAVFKKYIYKKPAVYLSVYPKGQKELIAAEDNYSRPEVPADFKNDLSEYETLKYVKSVDNFDRSKRPASGPNPVVQVPAFWNQKWSNGIQVIGTPYKELPTTNITIFIKAGQLMETIEKSGLASFTADMLMEGTKKYSGGELTTALNKLGSTIEIGADKENVVISVDALNKNLNATIEILKEILTQPRMDEEDFNRMKEQKLQLIQNQKTSAAAIAGSVMNKQIFPKGHVFQNVTTGTDTSVNNITLQDVKDFYNNFYAPDHAQIIIVGNINKKNVKSALGFLATMPKKGIQLPEFVSVVEPKQTTIYFSHKDRSPQSQVSIAGMGLRYDGTGDFYKVNIANFPLGGAFNSRININLREKNGYTYGARTGFSGTEFTNLFTGGAAVRADATDSAVVEIFKEIEGFYKDGITEEELDFTKKSVGQRDALKYETPGQKAGFIRNIILNNYDKDLVKKQLNILENLTTEELNVLIRKYINPNKLAVIVVGDRAIVLEKLKALGYPVIETDMYGNPIQ